MKKIVKMSLKILDREFFLLLVLDIISKKLFMSQKPFYKFKNFISSSHSIVLENTLFKFIRLNIFNIIY